MSWETAIDPTAHVIRETRWQVERDGVHVVGFSNRDKAFAEAKPRGRRRRGTVVRVESTRSWVVAGDTTITTEIIKRTVEPS